MDISTELFTVTDLQDRLVSIPMVHVVALAHGRFQGKGSVVTTAGGSFVTRESYQQLIEKWQELTKTV